MKQSCVGKELFATYGAAEKIAARGRRHDNRHPYRCSACNGFHIGSQVGRRRRRPHQLEEVFA